MTILGYHTAHELSDWIDALTVEMQDLGAARAGAVGQPYASDPTWAAGLGDHDALASDWEAVRAACATEIVAAKASFGGWDDTTEEDLWTRVATTFDPTATNHSRLADLERRWPSLPNNPHASFATRPVPQPTAADADLGAYNTLAKVDVIAAVQKNPNTTAWLIGGGIVAILLALRGLAR